MKPFSMGKFSEGPSYSMVTCGLVSSQVNLFQNKPLFLHVCCYCTFFENTVGKGEIAHNEQFLLPPQCFLHFQRTSHHFRQI